MKILPSFEHNYNMQNEFPQDASSGFPRTVRPVAICINQFFARLTFRFVPFRRILALNTFRFYFRLGSLAFLHVAHLF